LGISFQKEKHGKGALHYSAKLSDMVFELYPCKDNEAVSNIRFGIKICKTDLLSSKIQQWVKNSSEMAYVDSDGNEVFVVADPDKRKIEVCFER